MSMISTLSISALSSVASTLFDELHDGKLFSKIKYLVKKWFLKPCYCLVVDDYSYSQLNLIQNKGYILIHPETIYSLILGSDEKSNLKNLKLQSFDTYLLVMLKKIEKIILNMRFLHSKSAFIVVVSSYTIAKKLNFSDKKVFSFMMDDDLFSSITSSSSFNPAELAQFTALRNAQRDDVHLTQFESFKQLNNAIVEISDGVFVVNPNPLVIGSDSNSVCFEQ